MTAWCDGELLPTAALPPASSGAWCPFETLGAEAATLPLWDLHLARLARTAQALGLPAAVAPAVRGAATDLLLRQGHGDAILRLELRPTAAGVRTILQTRERGPRGPVALLPTVVERRPGDPPANHKLLPRRFYDAVRQQAQDGGADDGLVVAADGAVLETAVGNLFVRLDGCWVTPPLDGRVLPGIGRDLLCRAAAVAGRPVVERSLGLGDLHAASALAVTNAVHGPRPATFQGGTPAVAIVDSELGALWRSAASGSSR